MGKKSDILWAEEERVMQLLGEGHSTLEIAKTLGLWSQDNQEGGQQCQQGPDKENQEIQGQTHKAGLFTAFERGEEESPSNQQAGFWCVRNFRGEQDNTVSNSVHL